MAHGRVEVTAVTNSHISAALTFVKLPRIDPASEVMLTSTDTTIDHSNDAKVRQTNCGYAIFVNGVNNV